MAKRRGARGTRGTRRGARGSGSGTCAPVLVYLIVVALDVVPRWFSLLSNDAFDVEQELVRLIRPFIWTCIIAFMCSNDWMLAAWIAFVIALTDHKFTQLTIMNRRVF